MSTPSSRWQWPLDGQRDVIRSFEAPAHRYAAGHRGVDLAGEGAVRAVESGVVRFAGMVAGRGVVSITHHDGLVSTYEPVAASVTAGAVVHTGDTIGTLRSEAATAESTDSLLLSHCAERACLHLGARRGEDYLDPMLFLGQSGPSVLLPVAQKPPARFSSPLRPPLGVPRQLPRELLASPR